MVKRRFRSPGHSVSTKGHSVLHRASYGFTPARRFASEFVPEYVPRRAYDTSAEEYSLGSTVDHATCYSDASIYDTYDTASRSRGRDAKLLNDATAAIVSSEPHTASPRASAAVRRVSRKPAPPPLPRPLPYRNEAAIVASTIEIEPRRKRPRSKFAADKLRSTRTKGEESVGHDGVYTSGLHAHRPTMRTKAGYRLESRMDPTDIIYKPGSFVRMREQVRDAHDKLDRHRQLLDRYLTDSVPTRDVQSSVTRKMEDLERRDPIFRSSRKKHY